MFGNNNNDDNGFNDGEEGEPPNINDLIGKLFGKMGGPSKAERDQIMRNELDSDRTLDELQNIVLKKNIATLKEDVRQFTDIKKLMETYLNDFGPIAIAARTLNRDKIKGFELTERQIQFLNTVDKQATLSQLEPDDPLNQVIYRNADLLADFVPGSDPQEYHDQIKDSVNFIQGSLDAIIQELIEMGNRERKFLGVKES